MSLEGYLFHRSEGILFRIPPNRPLRTPDNKGWEKDIWANCRKPYGFTTMRSDRIRVCNTQPRRNAAGVAK